MIWYHDDDDDDDDDDKFSSYLVISYSFKVQLTALATVLTISL